MKIFALKTTSLWASASALLLTAGAHAQTPTEISSSTCQIGLVVPTAGLSGEFSPRLRNRTVRSLLAPRGSIARGLTRKHWTVTLVETADTSEEGQAQAIANAARAGRVAHALVITSVSIDAYDQFSAVAANLYNTEMPISHIEVRGESTEGLALSQFVNRLPNCNGPDMVISLEDSEIDSGTLPNMNEDSPIVSGPVAPARTEPRSPSVAASTSSDYAWLLTQLSPEVVANELAFWTRYSNWDCINFSFSEIVSRNRSPECRAASVRMETAFARTRSMAESGSVLPSRNTVFHDVYGNQIQSYENSVEYDRYRSAVSQLSSESRRMAREHEERSLGIHAIVGNSLDTLSLETCIDDLAADLALDGDQTASQSALCQMAFLNALALRPAR